MSGDQQHFKPNAYHNELAGASPPRSPSPKLEAAELEDPLDEKPQYMRLRRKIDRRLIPFFSLLYLLSFLDRTNIGNAKLDDLVTDLNMSDSQYQACLAIFYVTYVLVEVPSNMILKRTRPSIWIPFIMVAWSIVMTLMGLVHNFAGLFVARLFLGIAEGGLFPGVSYIISLWYPRNAIASRIAIFFASATIAGSFGGLLARGLIEMDGLGGKPGWAWIFIIEGLVTFVVGMFGFWYMDDYPSTSRFLTEEERGIVVRHLENDVKDVEDGVKLKYMLAAFTDVKVYLQMLIYIGCLSPVYSFSLFLPTIINSLGYSATLAQLLSTPPYAFGFITTVWLGIMSDRWSLRGPVMLAAQALGIVGYIIQIASTNTGAKYAATCIAAAGIFPNIAINVSWNANNTSGSIKRGVAMAMQIGFGNLGGIISSFTYPSDSSPRFFEGHGVVIGLLTMSFTCTSLLMFLLTRENRQREHLLATRPIEEFDHVQEHEKGDRSVFFRYTL